MLVDIQAKLAEGKGAGFARWAKQHNLKEMSRTLVFLQENKISGIEEMQERVDAATARYHELGDSMREVGSLRILFAAAISVIGKKIFRKKGWFYAVAGYRARSIDGPCHNTIPPYNHYVVLGPLKPDQVAKDIAARVGYDVAIVDINDLEGQILGASSKAVNKKLYARILKDNPLGQDDQQTPMGIIRRVD